MLLNGKVAVVTGSSRGIGREIALGLARQGAAVAVHYSSNREKADDVAATIRNSGGTVTLVQGDVTVASDVKRLVQNVLSHYGRIDILVNNAGWAKPVPLGNITALTEEIWDRTVDSCLKSVYLCSQAVVPHMKTRGNDGVIINIWRDCPYADPRSWTRAKYPG
jgi:3-oxoacyl-[acyl-carrier protein] reductase